MRLWHNTETPGNEIQWATVKKWFCGTVFASQLSQGWTAKISSVVNLHSVVTIQEKLGQCSPAQKAEQGSP